MRKSTKSIQGLLGVPVSGALMVVVSIAAFVAALWVIMTLTRVLMG